MRSPLAAAVLGTLRRTFALADWFNGGGEFCCPGGPWSVLTSPVYRVEVAERNQNAAISDRL